MPFISPCSFSYLSRLRVHEFCCSFSSKTLKTVCAATRENCRGTGRSFLALWLLLFWSQHNHSLLRGSALGHLVVSHMTPKLPQRVAVLLFRLHHLRPSALPIFDGNQSQFKYSTVQIKIYHNFHNFTPNLAIIYC